MRLKNIPGAREAIEDCPYCVKDITEHKGKWNELFPSGNKTLRIEIGCGKGRFIHELARQNPDINYIGIEYYSSVMIKAIKKIDEAEPPKNLLFICGDAKNLLSVFEKGEIDRIYLNFSDPWPKVRHAKRRLTSEVFLKIYNEILKPDGIIEFKTDNRDLFDYSVETAPKAGWHLDEVTYDLHNDAKLNEGNIMTEYEQRFSEMGNPICKYIISR